ncbi:hypothetical protein N0V90_012566 [Kalmusia sp. IMI 367209]|nr:hypothetical protein N0V90_012566 [Kalmusia sp. IMI 367209]
MPPTVESTEQQPVTGSAEPKVEVTINPKTKEPSSTEDEKDTPQLKRNDTWDSVYTDTAEFVHRGPARPFNAYDDFVPLPRQPRAVRRVVHPPRRYNFSPSPQRWRAPNIPITPILHSSTQLLEQLNYDGVADFPFPGKSSIYLTTFPFTDKDVKEWAWLFQMGIEEKFLHKANKYGPVDTAEEDGFDEDGWYADRGRMLRPGRPYHGRRDRSPVFFNDNTVDVPSVYLSRALDTAVISEAAEKDFAYLIVIKNRGRGGSGAKLLRAGSRKAAGIVMYYEALIGNSVVFVGAVREGSGKPKKIAKYRKVEGVEEAVKVTEEGVLDFNQ